MIFISVIVPVYNVDLYLARCLDSFKRQQYKNFEVLLINDGSTDKSGEICDTYASLDKRFRVYHRINGGVSRARNYGISIAKGDYITFVDSDDWIDDDYFELAAALLNTYIPDLLVNNFKRASDNWIEQIDLSSRTREAFSEQEALDKMSTVYPFGWEPVAKFYRRDRLINIRFNEEIKYGEDLLFNYHFLKQKKLTVIYEPVAMYNYYKRLNSAVNSYSLAERMDDIKVIQYIIKKEPNHIGAIMLKQELWPRLVNRCKDALLSMKKDDINHAILLSKILHPYFWQILLSRGTSFKTRIKLFFVGPFFYFLSFIKRRGSR